MTKESFGNAFSDACRKAGVNKSAHGLRKIGATRAANNGATVAQLNAIFGWTGSKMASLYTQNADRRRLAQDAITKLVNETATSIPSPRHKVRAAERKDKRKQRANF
jgi:integrase